MPILIKCSCGKQLRVPDEQVGRRVKCTACGAIQTVTAPKAGPEPAPGKGPAARTSASPAPEAGKPASIRFQCGACGKQMQTRAEHAGRTTKCPNCGAAVSIPRPDSAAADEAPDARPRSRIKAEKPAQVKREMAPALDELDEVQDVEEAIEEDEDEDRPRKKRGKKAGKGKKSSHNLGLLIGIGAGVLGLLVGVGILLWLLSSGGSVSDLAFVPGDAQVFVAIQAATLWNTPVVQDAVRELPPNAKDNLDEMEKKTGLKPADLDRAVLVVKDGNANQVWFVLSTLKPIDRKKMLDGMEADPTEKKHENKVYYTSKNKSGCLHFVSDKMVLMAENENAMKTALNQAAAPAKAAGRLTTILKLVDGRNQVVVGFVPPGELVSQGKQGLQGNPMFASLSPLLELQSGSVAVNVAGTSLQLEVTINFPADAQAKTAKSSLDTLKAQAALLLGFIQDAAQRADAQKALNDLSIDQKGPDVVVKASGNINVKDIVKAAGGAMQGPIGGPVGGTAGNLASQNNLKQIGLAFHTYADAHGGLLPTAVISTENKPLYSWRVELLPYLEQQNLYTMLRGKPWDNLVTRKRAEQRMPSLFRIPGRPAPPGMTYYKLFTGPKTLFDGNQQVKIPGSFPKGTSNTILAVEAATPVFWTQPDDIPFDPNRNPVDDLGWDANGSCNVLMADGSVRKISRTKIKPESLKNAIMPVEGGPPGPDF